MATADAVRDEWGLEASIARVKNRLDHGTRYRLADDMRDFAHLLRRVEQLEARAAGPATGLGERGTTNASAQDHALTIPSVTLEGEPVPSSAGITEPRIVEMAEGFAGGDPVNDLAILLMKTWGRVDPNTGVAKYPAGYMSTFADMARAVLAELVPLTREELAEMIPSPRVSERVADWPADEQEFHRNGNWLSFTDRAEQLDRMRRLKVADSILDRLRRTVPQSAGARAGSTP